MTEPPSADHPHASVRTLGRGRGAVSLPVPRTRSLPVPRTGFVGREREIAAVGELLGRDKVRLVTLTGPGGVGKTRLAQRVAAELALAFVDGVAFVDLAPVRDPELVASAITRALGITEGGDRPATDLLVDILRTEQRLLVLDNFEQVLPAGLIIAKLLGECPGLTFLVTSRAILRLSGEHDYPVPPLDVPASGAPLLRVRNASAVRLFIERAQAADPAFVLSEANAPHVTAICARLDGLPLAIELAAARVRLFPPELLAARLVVRLPTLAAGPRDVPDRLRTMRDAIAWSHDLLTADERVLFRRLCVFVGGFTLEAAEAVADGDGLAIDVVGGIESLADQSLVRRLDGGRVPRFGMLETVREYGLEQLAAGGEEATVRERHAAWCLAFMEQEEVAFLAGRSDPDWLLRIDADLANLRSAFAWFHQRDDLTRTLRLLTAIGEYWLFRPDQNELRLRLDAALSEASDVPLSILVRAHAVAGMMDDFAGDFDAALSHATKAVALGERLGDPVALGLAHIAAGIAHCSRGATGPAITSNRAAIALLRQTDARFWFAIAQAELGDALLLAGNVEEAAATLDEALVLHREIHYPWDVAVVGGERAMVALAQGDYPLAVALFADGIAMAQTQGAMRVVLGNVAGLAGVALALGDAERAARLLGAVDALQQRAGIGRISHSHHVKGIVAAVRSRLGEGAFAAARESGWDLPLDEVIADALAVSPPDSDANRASATPRDGLARFGLTQREQEVLRLMTAGKTDREIAETLFVSRRTITTHTSNVFAKLAVSGRAEAAALAVREGLV